MQEPWIILLCVLCGAVILQFLLIAGVLRHLAVVEERWNVLAPVITSFERGQRIADFELPDASGNRVRVTDLVHRFNGTVLLFATATCSACEHLLAQVEELAARPAVSFTNGLVVILTGKPEQIEQVLLKHPNLHHVQLTILADGEREVLRQFGITAVPVGLAVDHQGQVTYQTQNPQVANWLYTRLGITPPAEPVSSAHTSLIVPAALRR